MDINQKVTEELGVKRWQVDAAVNLIDEGYTIPFISRYRKEVTGSLNDEQLRKLYERLIYLRNLEEKKELTVKVSEVVNAGVVAYVEGIRGFIPASKLSLNYVEDLNEYLNKDIQVQVFDLDKEKDRLILSAREILREKADEERKEKISNVEVGLVTEGTVEILQPYGAFINLGNGLSGLVHISQICAKRIKHPSAVLAVGDKVKVKVIAIKDGKLSVVTAIIKDKIVPSCAPL